MTAAGAASRANYLVKWEAIRSSREAGASAYDMWGLVHPGIRQFKAGFGGREITYIGGWELALDQFGTLAYRVGTAGSERLAAVRSRRVATATDPRRPTKRRRAVSERLHEADRGRARGLGRADRGAAGRRRRAVAGVGAASGAPGLAAAPPRVR